MLGDGGVGKSCLTMQFTENKFVAEYDPTIENMYQRNLILDNDVFKLEILDTAGQEEYSIMQDQYIRSGHGFVVVFSIANQRTFGEVKKFFESIIRIKEDPGYPMVLVGNKSDLKREVTDVEVSELLLNHSMPYFLTSAKTGKNVEEPFICLTRNIHKYAQAIKPQKMIKKRRCLIL